MSTVQEKYDFLLGLLEMTDVDLWEMDALLKLKRPLYFQFSYPPGPGTIDECVQAALDAEKEFPHADS